MSNFLMVIHPYKDLGIWMFDDASAGLVREPFVLGMQEIIENVLTHQGIPDASRFKLYFSRSRFLDARGVLERWEKDNIGWWYRHESGLLGRLCLVLLMYFKTAPKRIYYRVEEEES